MDPKPSEKQTDRKKKKAQTKPPKLHTDNPQNPQNNYAENIAYVPGFCKNIPISCLWMTPG